MQTPSMAQPEELENASDYKPGDLIAERYRLLRPLSSGGMGELWVAHSLALEVKVAIKILHGSLADTEAADRMALEARAVARLGHPATVRVMDFGHTDRDHPYIVSELLEGEDLAHNLDGQGKLDPVIAVRTLLPIIDAVWTAHEKGIVHRDLKPDNIYLSRDQQGRVWPKVLDFGIAKLLDGDTSQELTEVGLVVGSPAYMSPEQSYGTFTVDHRTDIWSIAVVLYEMVTGTLPFVGISYHHLVAAIIKSPAITFREAGLEGQDELWGIVERCLRKDPSERFSSMRGLGETLAEWLHDRAVDEDICGNSVRATWLSGLVSDLELSTDGGARGHARSADQTTKRKSRVDAGPLPVPLRAGVELVSRGESGKPSRTMLYGLGSAAVTLAILLVGYAALSSSSETPVDPPGAGLSSPNGEVPAPKPTSELAAHAPPEKPDPAPPTETAAPSTSSAPTVSAEAGATSADPPPAVAPGARWRPPPKTSKKKKGLSGEPDFGF